MAQLDPKNPGIVLCDDGTKRRQNLFSSALSPGQLCGETPLDLPEPGETESPPEDDMFIEIFGPDPLEPGGKQSLEIRGLRVRWLQRKRRYGGVVAFDFKDDDLEQFVHFGIGVPVAYKYSERTRVAFPFAPASPPQMHSLSYVTGFPHHVIANWQIRANGNEEYCPKNIHPLASQAIDCEQTIS